MLRTRLALGDVPIFQLLPGLKPDDFLLAFSSILFGFRRVGTLKRIDELLEGRRCLTFNGKGFDLPVLTMTAMRTSAFKCRNLTDAWASQRYKGSHIDLADMISGYGSAPRAKLETLCEAAGIRPVPALSSARIAKRTK